MDVSQKQKAHRALEPERVIPRFTLEGVPDADVRTYHFTTADKLGLSMLRFQREPCDDVVLVIHGLTTSSDMFIMPEHENLVRLPAGPRFHRRVDARLPDEQPAPVQPAAAPLYVGRHRRVRLPGGRGPPPPGSGRQEVARHLSLPGLGLLLDEPVRRHGGGHHQRHRQQRGAHPAHSRLVAPEAHRGALPHRACAGSAVRGPERQPRAPPLRAAAWSDGPWICSTTSATCPPATCSA